MDFEEWPPDRVSTVRRLSKGADHHLVFEGIPGSIASLHAVEAGRWYHMAMVGDRRQASLFLDGVVQGRVAMKEPLLANGERLPVLLGGSSGQRNSLHGLLDEVAVYARALSPEELMKMSGACKTN